MWFSRYLLLVSLGLLILLLLLISDTWARSCPTDVMMRRRLLMLRNKGGSAGEPNNANNQESLEYSIIEKFNIISDDILKLQQQGFHPSNLKRMMKIMEIYEGVKRDIDILKSGNIEVTKARELINKDEIQLSEKHLDEVIAKTNTDRDNELSKVIDQSKGVDSSSGKQQEKSTFENLMVLDKDLLQWLGEVIKF